MKFPLWYLNFGVRLWFLLIASLLQSKVIADNRKVQLGEQRLFMSNDQRRQIEQEALVVDIEPVVSLPVVPTAVKKPAVKPKPIRVTLNGAVLRPNGSTVLIVNDQIRVIPGTQDLKSDSFLFSVKFKKRVVKLTPGQTVWVKSEDD